MAFYRIPNFPLFASIWRNAGAFPRGADIGPIRCQLRVDATGISPAEIVFDKGTDVRDNACIGASNDFIECPSASGRFYIVDSWVDDVAKGFPNEHRVARVKKVANPNNTLLWPSPIP